jgi:hypothetical protein
MKFLCNVLDPFHPTTKVDDHTMMAQSFVLGHINNKAFGDPVAEGSETVADLKQRGLIGVYEIDENLFRPAA